MLEKGVDGATHLIWKDRQTLQVVDDMLVFPGDQSFEKVDTGRPNDRVYLLSFKTSASRRFFFWMQEPDATKDEERIREFNKLMNEPASTAGAVSSTRSFPVTTVPTVELDELSNILAGLGYGENAAENVTTSEPSATASNIPETETSTTTQPAPSEKTDESMEIVESTPEDSGKDKSEDAKDNDKEKDTKDKKKEDDGEI